MSLVLSRRSAIAILHLRCELDIFQGCRFLEASMDIGAKGREEEERWLHKQAELEHLCCTCCTVRCTVQLPLVDICTGRLSNCVVCQIRRLGTKCSIAIGGYRRATASYPSIAHLLVETMAQCTTSEPYRTYPAALRPHCSNPGNSSPSTPTPTFLLTC
jgi:hypothetical protein